MPKPENIVKHKFKKGQSGNPKGRPKMPDLREALAEAMGETKENTTALSAIIKALRAKATRGDVNAAKLLLAYGYGAPDQKIKHEGNTAPNVTIKLVPNPNCEPLAED